LQYGLSMALQVGLLSLSLSEDFKVVQRKEVKPIYPKGGYAMEKTKDKREARMKVLNRQIRYQMKTNDRQIARFEKMVKTVKDPQKLLKVIMAMRETEKKIEDLRKELKPLVEERARQKVVEFFSILMREMEEERR